MLYFPSHIFGTSKVTQINYKSARGWGPQGADLPHFPLGVAKAGRNDLNEGITPILPTGIGVRYSQTLSNFGHAAILRRFETPPIHESAEPTQGAL